MISRWRQRVWLDGDNRFGGEVAMLRMVNFAAIPPILDEHRSFQ